MASVRLTAADGTVRVIEAAPGENLRDAALAAGIDGIAGICGGQMMCATCHVIVTEEWADAVGQAGEDEAAALDALSLRVEVRPTSRLACQIRLDDSLDGLSVVLPRTQPGI